MKWGAHQGENCFEQVVHFSELRKTSIIAANDTNQLLFKTIVALVMSYSVAVFCFIVGFITTQKKVAFQAAKLHISLFHKDQE